MNSFRLSKYTLTCVNKSDSYEINILLLGFTVACLQLQIKDINLRFIYWDIQKNSITLQSMGKTIAVYLNNITLVKKQ